MFTLDNVMIEKYDEMYHSMGGNVGSDVTHFAKNLSDLGEQYGYFPSYRLV